MALLMRRCHLALEYRQDLVPDGGCELVCCLAGPVKRERRDAAGHAFHEAALRQSGVYDDFEEEDTDTEAARSSTGQLPSQNGSAASLDDQPPAGTNWKSRGKKKKKSDQADLYALLGLQNERWTATDAQIKLGYRRAALECHPDKAGAAMADEARKAEIEEKFKAVQEAYETLSDPTRRREYDSVDDFDDTLPSDCAPRDFFQVFGPAFRRNARWSVATPVPEVGDAGMAWGAVDAFYDFWFGFRSWREFPHPDEEDVEQAESREERRWLERMNAKLREGGKKEERRRLKVFVEDAYRCDPRVIQHKEAQRAERDIKRLMARDRRKREKEEAAQAKARAAEEQAAAEAAAAAAAEAAAAEEAAEARRARQVEKKATQKERSRLRSLTTGLGLSVHDDLVETLCAQLPRERLAALNAELTANGLTRAQQHRLLLVQRDHVESAQRSEGSAKDAAAAAAAAKAATEAQEVAQRAAQRAREWGAEEVRMLQKALDKFPQGTAKRWDQVAAYVRTRTVEEVLDMVKHGLKAGKFAPNQATFTLAQKRQGKVEIHSEATLRAETMSDVEVNLAQPVPVAPSTRPRSTVPAPAPAGPTTAAPSVQASRQPGAGPASQRLSSQAPGPATGGAVAPPPPPADSAAGSAWAEDQELALVQALKKYGKDDPDRWERIAADVPGKGKASCIKRFKELRESFKANKKR